MDFWRNEVFPASEQIAQEPYYPAIVKATWASLASWNNQDHIVMPHYFVFFAGFFVRLLHNCSLFWSLPNFPSLFPIAQLLIIAKTLPSLPSFSRPTKTEGEWFCIKAANEALLCRWISGGVLYQKEILQIFRPQNKSKIFQFLLSKLPRLLCWKLGIFKIWILQELNGQAKLLTFHQEIKDHDTIRVPRKMSLLFYNVVALVRAAQILSGFWSNGR